MTSISTLKIHLPKTLQNKTKILVYQFIYYEQNQMINLERIK